jgi:Uma2 family endonuclease
MKKTGDSPTLDPEICVEVLSPNARWANIEETIGLYREAGAKDVWVVGADRQVRFSETRRWRRPRSSQTLRPNCSGVPIVSATLRVL